MSTEAQGAAAGAASENQVIAYLEALYHEKMALTLQTKGGVEVEASIQAIDEVKNRVTVLLSESPGQGLEPDDPVKLFFGRGGFRWMGGCSVQYFRTRTVFVLSIPRTFERHERRKAPRAEVPAALVVPVTLRSGQFEGYLIQGRLADLSEGGLGLKVESVQDLKTQQRLVLDDTVLQRDLELYQVKVGAWDELEGLEAGGRVAFWREQGGAWFLGLRFRNLKANAKLALEAFLPARLGPALEQLPPLARTGLPLPQDAGTTGVSQPSVTRAVAAITVPEPEPPAPVRDGTAQHEALVRLKKRGQSIVVAMPPSPTRVELTHYLRADGYGRVLPVHTLPQLMELLEGGPVHAVFIDGGTEELGGLQLGQFVAHALGDIRCPVILAHDEVGTSWKLLAKAAGVGQVLSKPYDFGSVKEILDQCLDEAKAAGRPRDDGPEVDHVMEAGRIKQLKRRKAVALLMPAGKDRSELQGFLMRDGFNRVLQVGSIPELVQTLRAPNLGLVLVDWDEPGLSGLDLARFLDPYRMELGFAVVLAAPRVDTRLALDAQEAGVSQVLVKPYAQDGTLTEGWVAFLSEE